MPADDREGHNLLFQALKAECEVHDITAASADRMDA
jgi:hypothetical protein